MVLIYKGFSDSFAAIDAEAVPGSPSVMVAGRRGYMRPQRQALDLQTLYLDEVHFEINAESWYIHNDLRERVAADPRLQGRVYAGCAGQVNLDYIAVSKAPAAVLYDINPLQALFWKDCFALMARTPERRVFIEGLRPLAEDLFYKIEGLYGQEIKLPSMSDPAPRDRWDDGSRNQSPFRGMSYGRIDEWAGNRMREAFSAAAGSWAAVDGRYAHLHMLAKNRALAAVTVDVRDRAVCRRIGECFDRARYEVVDAEGASQGMRTGARAGFLYRSNVGHYMKWNKAEIAAQIAGGHTAHDFSGQPVSTDTYRQMQHNLKYWQDPAGGHLIAADRHSGGNWGQFRPVLRAQRPFAPV